MPSATRREQAGTRVREPSSSTTQTRQALTGVIVGAQQIVGTSTPASRQASRMVLPSGADRSAPSMRTVTLRRGIPTGTGMLMAASRRRRRRRRSTRG